MHSCCVEQRSLDVVRRTVDGATISGRLEFGFDLDEADGQVAFALGNGTRITGHAGGCKMLNG
jgi:hypothetical protein